MWTNDPIFQNLGADTKVNTAFSIAVPYLSLTAEVTVNTDTTAHATVPLYTTSSEPNILLFLPVTKIIPVTVPIVRKPSDVVPLALFRHKALRFASLLVSPSQHHAQSQITEHNCVCRNYFLQPPLSPDWSINNQQYYYCALATISAWQKSYSNMTAVLNLREDMPYALFN